MAVIKKKIVEGVGASFDSTAMVTMTVIFKSYLGYSEALVEDVLENLLMGCCVERGDAYNQFVENNAQ